MNGVKVTKSTIAFLTAVSQKDRAPSRSTLGTASAAHDLAAAIRSKSPEE